MQYIELPYYLQQTLTIDAELNDLTDNCFEPRIIEGAVEGSSVVIISAEGMPNKVLVILNTGDIAYIENEFAIIRLKYPLRKGQTISVAYNAPNCKVSSCAVAVKGLLADSDACNPRESFLPAGTLTGTMRCDDKQLYRVAHDGNGGFMKGAVVYEDCIWCGGTKPDCEDE